jgi:hypothetical protein
MTESCHIINYLKIKHTGGIPEKYKMIMNNFNMFFEFFKSSVALQGEISFLVWFKILFILICVGLNIILFFGLDHKLYNKVDYLSSGFSNRIFSNFIGKLGLGISLYGTYLFYRSDRYNAIEKDNLLNQTEESLNKLKSEMSDLKQEILANECQNISTKEFMDNGVDSFSKLTTKSLELFDLHKKRDKLTEANGISKLDDDIKSNLQSTLYLIRSIEVDWKTHGKDYPNNIDSKALSEIKNNINNIEKIIITTVTESDIKTMDNKPSTVDTDTEPKQSFIFNGLIDKFEELDTMGKLAIALLLSKSLLISCFISIIFIYYGDHLISRYKLDIKYPKLAAIINLRKQFTKYYLISNCLTILFVILAEIIFSIAVLL